MATLNDNAIAGYAAQGGFAGGGLIMAVAIALAESGGDPKASGYNRDRGGKVTSVDRGLWQINNYWHSEVTDTCAYDPRCCAQAAFRISAGGKNWGPWSTYNSGAYKQFLLRAQAAASANVGRTPGSTPANQLQPPPTPGSTGTPAQHTLTLSNLLAGPGALQVETQVLGSTSEDPLTAYRYILALAVMFGFLYVLSKTRAGYAAIYYGEVLILFFLFATQAQFFREALLPLAPQHAETPATPTSQTPTLSTTL